MSQTSNPRFNLTYKKLEESDIAYLSSLDFKDRQFKDREELEKFIKKYAMKHQAENLGITYVISLDDVQIGYITISMGEIQKNNIDKKGRPSTRSTPIYPAMVIQYFAIHRPYRGRGIGGEVIHKIFGYGRKKAKGLGCRFLKLYAHDAIDFYTDIGFKVSEIPTKPNAKKIEFYMLYIDLFSDMAIKKKK